MTWISHQAAQRATEYTLISHAINPFFEPAPGREVRWPRPCRSFAGVRFHAPSTIGVAMLLIASRRTRAKSSAIIAALGAICGLICFDLSTPLKEFPHVLFSGMIKLVVGAVDMWARGTRVWAGGGQRASVVHGLSTRPEGRAPVRKDSSTYPPRSRTCRRARNHRKPRHGDGRVGSGQGRAVRDGGSC